MAVEPARMLVMKVPLKCTMEKPGYFEIITVMDQEIVCLPVLLERSAACQALPSQLSQWPVQIKLAPVNAPYFNGAKLLIAADCTAYSYASFHESFIKGRITLIGGPKLDVIDYSEKLSEIIRLNEIQSILVVRMEVPCCGGLEYAIKNALQNSGKIIPWQVVTLSTNGKILD